MKSRREMQWSLKVQVVVSTVLVRVVVSTVLVPLVARVAMRAALVLTVVYIYCFFYRRSTFLGTMRYGA